VYVSVDEFLLEADTVGTGATNYWKYW